MREQYTPTERKGVNAIEKMFLDIGWIFREQHTTDVGIDAQVEIYEHGSATGRVLALQIKSGNSYFAEETPSSYVFRGESKHLDYWINHSLPVILVLYHPGKKKAWWCSIQNNPTLTKTEKGWHVSIPKEQRLLLAARNVLREIALPNFLKNARLKDIASRLSIDLGNKSKFAALLDALHTANNQIDVISPFLDERLFLALAFCSHRVRVRLITGPSVSQEAVDEFLTRDHNGIEWRSHPELHGPKVIIIDDFLSIYGSANLTLNGWRKNFELIQASHDTSLVNSLTRSFEDMWNGRACVGWAAKYMGSDST